MPRGESGCFLGFLMGFRGKKMMVFAVFFCGVLCFFLMFLLCLLWSLVGCGFEIASH